MPQMFRVGDLAQQMGVSVDELIFKLRSIGVEVGNANDTLDLSTVRAIITGETLQRRPREVIVRRDAAPVEEARQLSTPALERLRRKRPARRMQGEEVPDQVPNLEAMTLPASAPKPRAVAPAAPAGVEEGREPAATFPEPGERIPEAPPAAEQIAAEQIAAERIAAGQIAAEAEAVDAGPGEGAAVEPLPEPTAAVMVPAAVAAAEVGEPAEGLAPAAPPAREGGQQPVLAEAASPEPQPGAATAEAPKAAATEAQAKAKPGKKKAARTPLESQLRELSDDEVKQRVLAAKQAAAKPAAPAPAARPARGKASRKAKSAADADEIRDLLAKFEESRVRVADAAPVQARPITPAGRQRPQRARRPRSEAPVAARAVTLEFRDGKRPDGPIYLSEALTVRELAEKLNVLVKDLMAYLISKKILVTANQTLPQDLAEEICAELDVEAMGVTFEEEIDLEQEETAAATGAQSHRPPVVTVMGHVDHGKTSLLDAIRSTRVAAGEAGGITQHVGASRIEHAGKAVVFIDTPGHEAFTQMRARGARVTDMVVLVVAADDGVMPQTIEAINHARAGRVPIIVAINKIDKPNANIDRVKKELAGQGVLVEGWGGDTPVVEVSALKRQGIGDLLEVILLVAEMADLKAAIEGPARGTVLEARRDRGRGVVATVLVQQGALSSGDYFFAGASHGRVRAMVDTSRKPVRQALPSDAVEIMGFDDLPEAGDTFQVVESEARAREVAGYRQAKQREEQMATSRKVSLEGLMDKIRADEVKALNIVLKADVQGSVEVLRDTLSRLSTPEVGVNVLHASAGAVTINDVLLASASNAVVIGFNVRPERSAKELAERESVDVRLYSVIYHLSEDIQKAMVGMLAPTFREEELGRAEVREVFHVSRVGTIAGCMVVEGAIPRNAKVRLLRDNVVVWEGSLASLKRFKDDAAEVKHGFECGIGLERYQDIKLGDVIEAYRVVEVARELAKEA